MLFIEDMPQMVALVLLLAILFIGDAISIRTKAWIPSVFICAVLFIAGYWTFFPKDIVARAGISSMLALTLMYLLIVNMGTLLSLRELLKQWKTIIISVSSIVGIVVFCFVIGSLLFNIDTVIIAIPALVGGIVSALMMSEGAMNAGLIDLAVFAVLIYVMQGFAGYPLTAIMLKKEGRRVLALARQNKWYESLDNGAEFLSASQNEQRLPKLLRWLPDAYNTSYFKFFRLAIVGFFAYLTSTLIQQYYAIKIHPLVLCLLFGVLATSIGFLEKQALQKANGFGFAVMALMLYIFDTLNRATPEMLWKLAYPLIVLIACTVLGMFIFSTIIGRLLGSSKEMAFAIALTALYGFPADYIITTEVINSITKDESERQLLAKHMLGPMLIGGFISVTIVSVILAGVMVNQIGQYDSLLALISTLFS